MPKNERNPSATESSTAEASTRTDIGLFRSPLCRHADPRTCEVPMLFGLPVTDHRRIPAMTVPYAHIVMQLHIDCLLIACPLKRQAKARLIEERRLIPGDREYLGY